MMGSNPSLIRRVVGFSLVLTGPILFSILAPIVARQGMLTGIVSLVAVVSCVALGSFLFLRVGFWNAVKSLLIVLTLSVPWFAIFFVPLPSEAQLMIAALVALVAVLTYRHYYSKRHSPIESSREEH